MIALKHNVSVRGVVCPTVLAITIVAEMFRVFRKDCIIEDLGPTRAVFRLKHFDKQDRPSVVNSLVSALGSLKEYTVEAHGTELGSVSVTYNA